MYIKCTAPTSSPENKIIEWEGTKEEGKTWAQAKTFFGALYKARRSYESDMKAHRSSFETANSFTQNPRNGVERSMDERSTDIAVTKVTTKFPTNQQVEYSDSLEESLLKANEYAATITSRAEADQTIIMAELKEQRKYTHLALDQNTKLMEMLVKSGMGGEATNATHDCRKKNKAERTCKNCKKSGYHEDDECFKLEKNAENCPGWYVKNQKQDGTGSQLVTFKNKNIIESNHMIKRILEIYQQNNTRTPLTSQVEAIDITPNKNINNIREDEDS